MSLPSVAAVKMPPKMIELGVYKVKKPARSRPGLLTTEAT
jgi:hypothetical protein